MRWLVKIAQWLFPQFFTAQAAPAGRVVDRDLEDDFPRYPPFSKGLPMAPADRIVGTQKEIIRKVREVLRFNETDFNLLVLPVISNYAAHVHLLPASENHHHRGAGGLFRHGLEVGLFAATTAQSKLFCVGETPQSARSNEPRWQFAAFLAGLLHDVGKPITDVSVTNKSGALEWNPYSHSIAEWSLSNNVDHYFLRWRDARHKKHQKGGILILDHILPQQTKIYLNVPGPVIMQAMLEAIHGTSAHEELTQLVIKADQESVIRDLRNQRLDVDEYAYGVPVERFVFDAIRRLASQKKINEKGSNIWRLKEGVFLVWKSCVQDILKVIEREGIPGIPRDHDTLADILIERGLAIPFQPDAQSKAQRYWFIYPEALGGIPLLCLRIDDVDLVFPNSVPSPAAASFNPPVSLDNELDSASAETRPTATEGPRISDQSETTSLVNTLTAEEKAPAVAVSEGPRRTPAWTFINDAMNFTANGNPVLEKILPTHWAIHYPDMASLLAEPKEVMRALDAELLLWIEPPGMSKLTLHKGRKYLVISETATDEITKTLYQLIENLSVGQTSSNPDPVAMPEKAPPKRRSPRKEPQGRIVDDAPVVAERFQRLKIEFMEQVERGFGPYLPGDVRRSDEEGRTVFVTSVETFQHIADMFGVTPMHVQSKLGEIPGVVLESNSKSIRITKPL